MVGTKIHNMTPQQIENTKTIVEFLGGKVEVSYENKTTSRIEYSVRGKVVEDWRAKGLDTKGYKDGMLLDNCKFHSSWDWIGLIISEMLKKHMVGDRLLNTIGPTFVEQDKETCIKELIEEIVIYNNNNKQ